MEKLAHKSKQPDNCNYLTDVEIFNKIMFEYAKTGKTTKINLLFKKMHLISADPNETTSVTSSSNQISTTQETKPFKTFIIKPNMNSYTAALQSLGFELNSNAKDIYRIKLQVERIIWDMRKANLSLDTLANNLLLSSEQQNYIKSALNLILPNFEFRDHIDFFASSPLLRNLKIRNSTNQNKRNIDNFYPKEMIDKKVIIENFDTQLLFEAKSLTSVPSIVPVDKRNVQFSNVQMKKNNQVLREKILSDFRETLSKNFLKNITNLKSSNNFQNALIYPFLKFMDSSVYVDLLLQEVIKLSQNSIYFSESVRDISLNIGNALETKYLHFIMNKNGDLDKVRRLLLIFLKDLFFY